MRDEAQKAMSGQMLALIMKAITKTGSDACESDAASLFEIGAKNIDGVDIANLGSILEGKKCTMVVNVGSK